jgi:hypothetical protein
MLEDKTREIPEGHPLRQLFQKLTETSLTHVGLKNDIELTVYISDLLVRFVYTDNLYKLKNAAGERLVYIVDMLLAADGANFQLKREVRKHIGDYSLFILGLFPESLDHPRRPLNPEYYVEQGKESYSVVAEMDQYKPTASLFRKLSDKFEYCISALSIEKDYLQDPVHQYLARQMGWLRAD